MTEVAVIMLLNNSVRSENVFLCCCPVESLFKEPVPEQSPDGNHPLTLTAR